MTGLAVSPVADLTSFFNVNGSYTAFNGKIGEILYVTFWDTGGGFRNLATGQPIRSGLLAFPIADVVSPVAAPPGVISRDGISDHGRRIVRRRLFGFFQSRRRCR